ncbi:MAG: hypothetical protein ACO3EE_11675, partial [Flavobacteriales bacterium]
MDFTERMTKNSNEQLIQIVTELRHDFQPKAVLAAEEELKKRSLTSEQLDKIQNNIREEKRKAQIVSEEPLSLLAILLIIATFGIFTFLIYVRLKSEDKTVKAQQLK